MFGSNIRNGQFTTTVDGLTPDTWYEFKIYAENMYGVRGYNMTSGNTTAKLGRIIHLSSLSIYLC